MVIIDIADVIGSLLMVCHDLNDLAMNDTYSIGSCGDFDTRWGEMRLYRSFMFGPKRSKI